MLHFIRNYTQTFIRRMRMCFRECFEKYWAVTLMVFIGGLGLLSVLGVCMTRIKAPPVDPTEETLKTAVIEYLNSQGYNKVWGIYLKYQTTKQESEMIFSIQASASKQITDNENPFNPIEEKLKTAVIECLNTKGYNKVWNIRQANMTTWQENEVLFSLACHCTKNKKGE